MLNDTKMLNRAGRAGKCTGNQGGNPPAVPPSCHSPHRQSCSRGPGGMQDIRLQHRNKTPNSFLFNEGSSLLNSRARLLKNRRWPHECLSISALVQIQMNSTHSVSATSFPGYVGSATPRSSLSALCSLPPNMNYSCPRAHSSSPHTHSLCSHVSLSGSKSTLRQCQSPH